MHSIIFAVVVCAGFVFGHASSGPDDPEFENCQAEMTAFPLDPGSKCCKSEGPPNNALTQQPWAALVEYELKKGGSGRSTKCAGTLISARYVLTASHCVSGAIENIATPTSVILGDYDLTNNGVDCVSTEGGGEVCNDGPIRIEIEKTIPHPEYNGKILKRNDIALIRLKEAAPYSVFIRPVCLPTKNPQTSAPDAPLVAVTWFKDNEHRGVKMLVTAPFTNQEKCKATYSKLIGRDFDIGSGQICAGGIEGMDTCVGDGGGPLVYENQEKAELIGAVSFGPIVCGQKDVPSVYTNVYEYIDWIKSNIVA